jgi:hypothetical protein
MNFEKRMDLLGKWDPGTWIIFPIDFLYLAPHDPMLSITLAEVINFYRVRLRKKDKGWVTVPTKGLLLRLPYGRFSVERLMKEFIRLGLIQTRRSSTTPPSRQIRINPLKLTALCHESRAEWLSESGSRCCPGKQLNVARASNWKPESGSRCCPGKQLDDQDLQKTTGNSRRKWRVRVSLITEQEQENKRYDVGTPIRVADRDADRSSSTSLSPKEISKLKCLADQLAEAVRGFRRISKTTSKWWKDLKLLHTTDKVPLKDIQRVLNAYCSFIEEEGDQTTNGNPKHVHIAHSTKSFRKKFDDLEADMQRLQLELDGEREGIDRPPRIDCEMIEDGDLDQEDLEKFFDKLDE